MQCSQYSYSPRTPNVVLVAPQQNESAIRTSWSAKQVSNRWHATSHLHPMVVVYLRAHPLCPCVHTWWPMLIAVSGERKNLTPLVLVGLPYFTLLQLLVNHSIPAHDTIRKVGNTAAAAAIPASHT